MCSPSQGPCCKSDCSLKYGDKCRDDNGCREPSYCDGRSAICPPSVNKPNKTICNKEFVCYMGVSRHFYFLLCIVNVNRSVHSSINQKGLRTRIRIDYFVFERTKTLVGIKLKHYCWKLFEEAQKTTNNNEIEYFNRLDFLMD